MCPNFVGLSSKLDFNFCVGMDQPTRISGVWAHWAKSCACGPVRPARGREGLGWDAKNSAVRPVLQALA
jgi:hypothetical protein